MKGNLSTSPVACSGGMNKKRRRKRATSISVLWSYVEEKEKEGDTPNP